MSLYVIWDGEEERFIVARSMGSAVEAWQFDGKHENEPEGVGFVSDEVYVDPAADPDRPPSWVAYDEIKAKAERMEKAIRWALGTGKDDKGLWFGDREVDLASPPLSWRKKLQEMSGVDE